MTTDAKKVALFDQSKAMSEDLIETMVCALNDGTYGGTEMVSLGKMIADLITTILEEHDDGDDFFEELVHVTELMAFAVSRLARKEKETAQLSEGTE